MYRHGAAVHVLCKGGFVSKVHLAEVMTDPTYFDAAGIAIKKSVVCCVYHVHTIVGKEHFVGNYV